MKITKNELDRINDDEIYFKFKHNNIKIEVWYEPLLIDNIEKIDLIHIIKKYFIPEVDNVPITQRNEYYLLVNGDENGILFYYLKKKKKIYIDSIEIVDKIFISNYENDIKIEKEKRLMMCN